MSSSKLIDQARERGAKILPLGDVPEEAFDEGLVQLPTYIGMRQVNYIENRYDGPWAVTGCGDDSQSFSVSWDTLVALEPGE